MLNECAYMHVHTPRGKCLIDDYSQRYLALPIPGSRLNSRNAPGTRSYCNCQWLQTFCRSNKTEQNLTP